jgi:hypothetical protein
MLVSILLPSGITSPSGDLFNYYWITILVVAFIVLIGAIYVAIAHPARRINKPAPR